MTTRQRLLAALSARESATNEILAQDLRLPVLMVAASMRRMESSGLVERAGSAPAQNWKGREVGGPRKIIWRRA